MADGTEEDGMEFLHLRGGGIRQRFTRAHVAFAAEVEGHQVEFEAVFGGGHV